MGDQFVLVPMQHRYLVGTQKSTDTIRYILEWNMKIDTQGMSFGDGKSGRTLEEQRAAIKPMQVNKLNIISDSLKIELKDLINEVLDERELEKKLNGPYDVFEDGEGEWGTY